MPGPWRELAPASLPALCGPSGWDTVVGTVEEARDFDRGFRPASNRDRELLDLAVPDDLRAPFTRRTPAALVAGDRPPAAPPRDVIGYAVRIALRELGRRAEFLDGQLERLDELIARSSPPATRACYALYGIGPHTAALLLIAAGDHPGRLRSEAAWAHLCVAAPILASSGKVTRHRLNPGGDRQANHALWRIVFTRWARTRPPAPTPSAARPKESPRRRSSAA